jgi:type II secretory pathway predicted ATPase ExeA
MYEAFYHLKEAPFSINPDPEYLYFGRRHSYAYAMMKHGIKDNSNFIVISGEIGCGKTTLVRHLLNDCGSDITVGLISNTHREMDDLFKWVMLAFGLPYEGVSRQELDDAFRNFLIEQHGKGKPVLLIVDEAQNISFDALESLRSLLRVNTDKHQLLQIMLIGQPELRSMLSELEISQFSKRIAVDFHIKPFEATDVQEYIHHRLKIAGRESPLFTAEACAKIATVTKGVPRRINVLCNTALMYGFSAESDSIDADLIEEVLIDKVEYGAMPNPENQRGQETINGNNQRDRLY